MRSQGKATAMAIKIKEMIPPPIQKILAAVGSNSAEAPVAFWIVKSKTKIPRTASNHSYHLTVMLFLFKNQANAKKPAPINKARVLPR